MRRVNIMVEGQTEDAFIRRGLHGLGMMDVKSGPGRIDNGFIKVAVRSSYKSCHW